MEGMAGGVYEGVEGMVHLGIIGQEVEVHRFLHP